jgi:hypothetical protein
MKVAGDANHGVANAGLSSHESQLSLPVPGTGKDRGESSDLLVAPDHSRGILPDAVGHR